MQLNEFLPFDIRQVMRTLPADGKIRHEVRQFTLEPRVDGRARSVRQFAEQIGFEVRTVPLTSGVNGRLVQDAWAEIGYRIEVSEDIAVEAQRFTVLHEMGHYFRHVDKNEVFGETRHFDPSGRTFYLSTSEEREANEFAEALLFGGGQLGGAIGIFGRDFSRLAKHFGVSQRVVQIAYEKLRMQPRNR